MCSSDLRWAKHKRQECRTPQPCPQPTINRGAALATSLLQADGVTGDEQQGAHEPQDDHGQPTPSRQLQCIARAKGLGQIETTRPARRAAGLLAQRSDPAHRTSRAPSLLCRTTYSPPMACHLVALPMQLSCRQWAAARSNQHWHLEEIGRAHV